jgi:hypothetical protein
MVSSSALHVVNGSGGELAQRAIRQERGQPYTSRSLEALSNFPSSLFLKALVGGPLEVGGFRTLLRGRDVPTGHSKPCADSSNQPHATVHLEGSDIATAHGLAPQHHSCQAGMVELKLV